jgi:hypothetical protein
MIRSDSHRNEINAVVMGANVAGKKSGQNDFNLQIRIVLISMNSNEALALSR